jgi:hypothetical protein
MATKYLRLRAVAALVACGSLFPVACGGDDDTTGNPAPSTGGTGAKGGSGNKGGSSNKGGTGNSDAGTGDTGTGGSTGGTSGGKGGTGGKGGSSNVGGTNNVAGDGTGNTGNEGGTSPGTGGTIGTAGTDNAGTGNQPEPGGCVEADLNDEDPPCYEDCDPKTTDDSSEFLNRCADGTQTLGGIDADCTPWSGALSALGDGCTKVGDGCVLPDLP